MTYEKAVELFENAYNAVLVSGVNKDVAAVELAKIIARFENGHGFPYRVRREEAPILNGRAAAYRELIAA